jgi:hypothetical protein
VASENGSALLDAISAENLGVYRASPIRLREDVSQEAQISSDYRGRLVYELLQNADDAMGGQATLDDRIVFRLTDEALWVGNAGRPLNESDVEGLCGIGASSKGEVAGRRRASIGHKGMGFKSVLEITAAPEVFSDDYAFRLAAEFARGRIDDLMEELGRERPKRVPVMRFPSPLREAPEYWAKLRDSGIRTLFCFPLRPELTDDQRSLLAERLLALPVTTILFLKHLERVEVTVDTQHRQEGFSWRVSRERQTDSGWESCAGLTASGIYRINIATASGETHEFLLAHDADVEIGEHRGGLDSYAWEAIEVSEVSVATLLSEGTPAIPPDAWRHFHVFLPTAESCPYPLLVNGAFVSDLSRQEIRVGEEQDDYNSFLMQRVAALFRDRLCTQLERDGATTGAILRMLDREVEAPGAPSVTAAGQALYIAMRDELGAHPFLPRGGGRRLALNQCVVPPLVADGSVGERFRALLSDHAEHDGRYFPEAILCRTETANIAVDHGANELSAQEAASVLGSADLGRIHLEEHPSGGLLVDPVLRVLQGLWEGLDWTERDELVDAVRREPLFPVSRENGVVQRVATEQVACFYPPRSLQGTVPLERLKFLMQELCWGALIPTERNQLLKEELVAWQALFELREFKFPDVMRASVLPALELDPDEETSRRLAALQNPSSLAAICQLAGRAPDPSRPLRYERLGSNRALFNLSRLPVPCRPRQEGVEWRPAYQVYLGRDWIGDASIEEVMTAVGKHADTLPDIPLLAGPELFDGLLTQFRHLEEVVEQSDADEDEVGLEEDEEAPPDEAERDRWSDFLTWIGVNRTLRPVHFHDVEDRAAGWLTTKDLGRPEGWAFQALAPALWDDFREAAVRDVSGSVQERDGVPYFYRLHDLEHVVPLLKAAAADQTTEIAQALFTHLALNWDHLERFTNAEVAIVPKGQVPAMRQKPPRAREDEIIELGEDLWVRRLRTYDWCPTTHGPRRPRQIWLRTPEVERRFGRLGSDAGDLLPLLDVEAEIVQGRARGLAHALGIRVELTPSSFTPDDARLLLERLNHRYGKAANAGELSETALRQVLRPAYRNLMELLPGAEATLSPAYAAGILAGSLLLIHDGQGGYRFDQSDRVLYADKGSTRERLGRPQDLWTFILEATPAARGPLTTLLGVRVLEEEITWTPKAGDPPFDQEGVEELRKGIRDLAPYVLARLRVERQEERQAAQDGRRLREFAELAEPVTELAVTCRLDGREVGGTISREAFVDVPPRGRPTGFIVWGANPWPPTPEEGEALAMALADLLDSGHLEAFLALINARSHDARDKLLRLAGASTNLEAARDALDDLETGPDEGEGGEPEKTPGEEPTDDEPTRPGEAERPPAPAKTPLFRIEELLVDGVPIAIAGESFRPRAPGEGDGRNNKSGDSHGAGYGGHTDLGELDRLGMRVALTFERNRLLREGGKDAEIFDATDPSSESNALVFDVSTLERRDAARKSSPIFREAFASLESHGISAQVPGFDILTLDPDSPSGLGRLIELKSSGVSARLQEMSWNEWKSAKNSSLRHLYYLYLVGNLRSDLGDAVPFIRTVHDPFDAIWAEEVHEESRSRKVQLHVTQFKAAEHLDLGVQRASAES